jgi:catechol 2,3-dioxygenase-like lactoylglutathione lyase family enzyme
MENPTDPILKTVDCIRLRVSSLEEGLAFYRDRMKLRLIWRMETSVGLGMPDCGTEIVLTTEEISPEIDFLVESADTSAEWFRENGGTVVEGPFETPIGSGYVVEDPWRNRYVLLDAGKGFLQADGEGRVVGHMT